MVLIYVKFVEWVSNCSEEWSFVVDTSRRGRMVTLETTTPLEKLKWIVCEDYGVDHIVLNTEPTPNRLRRVVSSGAFPAGRIVLVVAAAVDAVMFPTAVTVASVAAMLSGVVVTSVV
ncbi:hypothetical protein F2Q68_00014248 [Brassica cretica]|uniref:Uncharacterized protein n=1 Tax=Brassica cretica TaxID=69181 RepID=A0A8S9HNQ8_BRACR|nr:hypothetical protein F2Q68_00014248 [Brassica cretica]